jgi:geranylgeranyl diphosphate synthase type I
MRDQDQWVERVNTRLDQFITDRESILREVSTDLEPFIEFSRQFLSGGKRFRARCALLGYGTQHENTPDHVIDVASALEIFHAAALVLAVGHPPHTAALNDSTENPGGAEHQRISEHPLPCS